MPEDAIEDSPPLPPGFTCLPAPDPAAAALAHAAAGGDPGALFWADGDGRCRAAIVLAPDRPIDAETLRALGLVTLFDAVAALAPPQQPVHATPDGALLVDGARAGTVTAVLAGAVPDWAVIGFTVALAPLPGDPGATPGETSLAEEGFGIVPAQDLLAAFCRHLLGWIDAWREDGAPALAHALQHRTPQFDRAARQVQPA